jgi:hypothetical protein
MPYCSQCGVEVDKDVEKCPLCQTPIQKLLSNEPRAPYPPLPAGAPPVPPLSVGEKMAISRTVSTIGILIPLLFITAIDYFINRRISWSSYIIASLVGAWGITLVSLFSWKRPYILSSIIHLDILIFLYIVGIISGNRTWFLPVALPITLSSCLLVNGAIWFIRRMKKKGANVAAVIILVISLCCASVDLVLERYIVGVNSLGWSLIVFSVLIPTSLLLFYVQSPRFSHSWLKRFLHF